MLNIVDNSSPAEIAAAIKKVQRAPELRSQAGIEALWRLFKATDHALPYREFVEETAAPNLHFGWFCRRVSEELGSDDSGEFALADESRTDDGTLMLRLKPSVVAAMGG